MSVPVKNAIVMPDGPLPLLPPSIWESREIREAVASDSPGTVIAIARKAHGLRQDELGVLAGFSQSAISRLESGSNIAYDMRVLRTLQRLLGIPAYLLGLADRTISMRSSDVRRFAGGVSEFAALDGHDVVAGLEGRALKTLFKSAVFGSPSAATGMITDEAVSQLLVLRLIVNEAHSHGLGGPGALIPAVRLMCDFVDGARRSAHGELRRSLLAVSAMYAEFYGWLHQEAGDLRGACQWTRRALEQGQAADDRDVIAYSYVRMSQLAEADGDDDRLIGLARAAQRETGAGPLVRAMALRQEARGLARTGQAACMSRLDLAHSLGVGDHHPDTDEYRIGYHFTEEHVDIQRAACLVDLGRPREAISVYEDVQQRWSQVCHWEQGLHTARLAFAHAVNGDVDHAADLGSDALELARSTGSKLVVEELSRLEPWADQPAMAEVTDAVTQMR